MADRGRKRVVDYAMVGGLSGKYFITSNQPHMIYQIAGLTTGYKPKELSITYAQIMFEGPAGSSEPVPIGQTIPLSKISGDFEALPAEVRALKESQLTSKVQDSGRMEDDRVGYCHLPPLKSHKKS